MKLSPVQQKIVDYMKQGYVVELAKTPSVGMWGEYIHVTCTKTYSKRVDIRLSTLVALAKRGVLRVAGERIGGTTTSGGQTVTTTVYIYELTK